MILPFSTKFKNGEPTYFIEKIWSAISDQFPELSSLYRSKYLPYYKSKFGTYWDIENRSHVSKKHTLRQDVHNRWKAGVKIHFTVFNRSKNSFQFAPIVECTATQKVDIRNRYSETWDTEYMIIGTFFDKNCKCNFENYYNIFIDDRMIDRDEADIFARNDGFENIHAMMQFLNPYNNEFFWETYKLIHWTDLKY